MSFREQILGLLRSGVALTAAGSILTTGSYVMYKDHIRFLQMQDTFATGNILAPLAENQHEVKYYKRPDIEKKLEAALRSKFTNEYYLINGEVGSGKTRTIVEIVRRKIEEDGGNKKGAPIYVLATQGKCFADTLARAINFHFDEHISFKFFLDFVLRIHSFPEKDEHHKLLRVLDALENAAFGYMQKSGKPVVLVIDGVNTLSKHSPGVLEKLQEKAKLWADTNIIKLLFVSNDEKTELLLQEHASDWSRAASPIYIGDMTMEQAIEFMCGSQFLESDTPTTNNAMSPNDAIRVYKLVGGRVQHLIAFKRDHQLGIPFEMTAEELKCKEREKFMNISKSSAILKLIKSLADSKGVGIALWKLVDASTEADVGSLLKSNIIRIERKGNGMVAVFESALAENVATTMLNFR